MLDLFLGRKLFIGFFGGASTFLPFGRARLRPYSVTYTPENREMDRNHRSDLRTCPDLSRHYRVQMKPLQAAFVRSDDPPLRCTFRSLLT
jgi:hypothetical protein